MTAREIVRRCLAGGTVGLIATVMYHGTQFLGASRAEIRSDCYAWHWLAFRPAWFWPYSSFFLLLGIPWFSLRSWTHVINFGIALVMAASLAWVTFVLYPTACARPAIESVPAYVAGLYQIDWPNNCFPCLHSTLAVLGAYGSACGASRAKSALWRLVLGIWLVAILLSIIALRQHTGVDLVSGIVLGIAAIYVFRRLNAEPTTAASTVP